MQQRAALFAWLPALLVLVLVAFGVSLAVGSTSLSWHELWTVLTGGGDDLSRTVVMGLRLPRALSAFAVGGLLALAGTLMQVLLRNPLADPYILGVSGGAAVGALGAFLLGLAGLWVNGGAFAGALLSTLLVFALAHGRGGWTPTRLLLTGIAVAAGWGAAISLLLVMGSDASLHSMIFWLMGDFSYQPGGRLALAMLALGLAVCWPFARQLNVLARGETLAEALGIAVRPLSLAIYIGASLFTAVAVTEAGAIGFVGLVVPHMFRMLAGGDHRRLLPGAVLLGGCLLMLADTLARTVAAPRQLPVGVVTAALGVPLFLYLLNRARGPL
ncbi:MAG TPA: iron ABC transporter permease [Gammaproteobacteria bacterium]|jgi:iron complex transport system permease protein|nr:iron ABC transporter permease [Gammaproteobacteria bacterium]